MTLFPRTFISYSYDSDDHVAWVGTLATDLVSQGVNVVLDQWDLRAGADVTSFMERGLSEADRVVVVCSPRYVDKANSGISGGVPYERMIISAEFLRNLDTTKFIPIVRNSRGDKVIPRCFGARKYIDFDDDFRYHERLGNLVAELLGQSRRPPSPAPPVSFAVTVPANASHPLNAGAQPIPDSFVLKTQRPNPQWADYRDFLVSIPVPWRLRCKVMTESPYFRFGFKVFGTNGRVFGDASIKSNDPNVHLHIGRNNWDRPHLGISTRHVFFTAYLATASLENDRCLFESETRLQVPITLSIERSYRFEMAVGGVSVFQTIIPPEISHRVAVYGWGDREEFEITVSDFAICALE